MHACVCVGRLGEAEALLEPLRERSGAVSRPVVSGHNLLMKAHAQAANPDAARKLFAAMKARGLAPDAVTYNTLLGAFVSAGEVLRAKAVLDKMQREGVAPDGWSYTTLLLGLGQAGQLREARQLLGTMAAAGLAPNEVRTALLRLIRLAAAAVIVQWGAYL
jgi:pentatricopeptide repeat protein